MRIINLLNRVIGNQGRPVKKANEYMWWSPFIHHHKPKLQINIKTGKWHCWVSNQGGHNLFQLLKKLKANREQYQELSELVGSPKSLSLSSNRDKVNDKILRLPNEFKPMWSNGGGIIQKHSWVYLQNRGITKGDILRYWRIFIFHTIFINTPTNKIIQLPIRIIAWYNNSISI